MGLRFRKSIKICKGVKLNINKNSIGLTAGVRGAHVTLNSKGKVTTSVGLPGTGISYSEATNLSGGSNNNTTSYSSELIPSSSPSPNHNNDKTPFYKRTWFMVLMLLLCAPLGIFLIWKYSTWGKASKITASIVSCFIFISAFPSGTAIETISISSYNENQPMDISNAQTIEYTYSPADASVSNLAFITEDNNIATLEKQSAENGKIICVLNSVNEGITNFHVKSSDISSEKSSIVVQDFARIEAERKAEEERLAAEKKAEEERIAAEKKAEEERLAAEKKAAEEKKAEEERLAAQAVATSSKSSSSSSSGGSYASKNTPRKGKEVYITPSGKRYHLDPDCGGKNSYDVDINNVGSRTPCKKCAS